MLRALFWRPFSIFGAATEPDLSFFFVTRSLFTFLLSISILASLSCFVVTGLQWECVVFTEEFRRTIAWFWVFFVETFTTFNNSLFLFVAFLNEDGISIWKCSVLDRRIGSRLDRGASRIGPHFDKFHHS